MSRPIIDTTQHIHDVPVRSYLKISYRCTYSTVIWIKLTLRILFMFGWSKWSARNLKPNFRKISKFWPNFATFVAPPSDLISVICPVLKRSFHAVKRWKLHQNRPINGENIAHRMSAPHPVRLNTLIGLCKSQMACHLSVVVCGLG